ncbi:MAG: L-threonine 3-dehydrogenase [Planctomycetota bacterium]|nr:L-threonine 3-dehydrogenase [Planctomycetota bacterium]MEE3295931.1 L-threonine 3-dehydrogenase [Planctomycetota bacterium]
MSKKMLAVRKVAREPGLVVDEIPVPVPGKEEVLVEVQAAGICGTDLHIWKWDSWSRQRIKTPLTLGHEFSGTVVEVGSKVEHARVGDFVSAESHVTCGMCYQCRTGQAHLCPRTQILGVDREGAFAEYVCVPEKVIWQNDPGKISPEIAALQEPFGNAVFATLNQDITGKSVGILGCGPIGLFSVGIARASGASHVFASDLNETRLALAMKMGADATFNPAGGGNMVDDLVEANDGRGLDVVLEMSGSPIAINTAFRSARNGGTVVLFGIPSDPVEIDIAENMIFKNLQVTALNGRRIFDTWYKTRWLLANKVVDLSPLITRTIGFEEVNECMPMLAEGNACKLVLLPNHRSPAGVEKTEGLSEIDDSSTQGTVTHR